MADEVYDFLTFDGLEHVSFATLGDNWERTVTVKSGGKLLNATGWKVGWAIAPPRLLRHGAILNSTLVYCQNTPAQYAMARSLELIRDPSYTYQDGLGYAAYQRKIYTEVRDYLNQEIAEMDLPWKPLPCHSGYFMIADASDCRKLVEPKYLQTHDYDAGDADAHQMPKVKMFMPQTNEIPLDLAFCRWMGSRNKVAMMPLTFFYKNQSPHMS